MPQSVSNALPIASSSNLAAAGWLHLAGKLNRCSRLLGERIAQEAERQGISEPQFALLWSCLASPAEGVSQSELADVLLVSPAHVSGLVEQLRRRGLLEGRRSTKDRRKQIWQLTPQGRATMEALVSTLTSWTIHLESQLERQVVGQLSALLAQLHQALRHEPRPATVDEPRILAYADSRPAPTAAACSSGQGPSGPVALRQGGDR